MIQILLGAGVLLLLITTLTLGGAGLKLLVCWRYSRAGWRPYDKYVWVRGEGRKKSHGGETFAQCDESMIPIMPATWFGLILLIFPLIVGACYAVGAKALELLSGAV